ncbi:hypothetical protein ACQKFO_23135 [Rossellomorea sp. NPDC071047]|uniref:hypothetical protein n=1 Tax=Rossellomorea sp. NPDC071047 TaxID=3390675 RepID=UPI003CFD265C
MSDNQEVKYEVYDDRKPSETLFSHESAYVCTRYIDNEGENKGQNLASHLWFRTVPN